MARHYPTLTRNGFLLPSNIKASYEGAGEGRRSASWEATDNGINSINTPALRNLRARSRAAVRNDPYAFNVIDKGLGFAKVGAPMALIEAGLIAADTYQNAETRDEKAEGYGNAAGTLAGTLAGAAAGAAIGSVVPVIGTVVGGLIGGFLGSWGGGELGSAVGKAAFGEPDKPIERLAQPSPLLLPKPSGLGTSRFAQLAPTPATGPLMGDVARSLATGPSAAAVPALLSAGAAAKPDPARVEQAWTFAPTMPVTVQGDVKDPRQLAQEMMPYMRQLFEEFSREQARRNLFDTPHV